MEVMQIGNLWGEDTEFKNKTSGRVYAKCGISPALNTMQGGWKQPMIIDDTYANREPRVYEDFAPSLRSEREGFKTIVAMRGRYEEDGICQKLEPNGEGMCNTLTSVTKDNLVMEPILVGGIGEKWGEKQYRQGNRVYDSDSVAMALTAQPLGNNGGNSYMYLTRETQYRIRKLTPLECWRLMDFKDEDFHKAAEVNSNTQLYKQSGNSICRNVLVAIFGMMIPGKENIYKEMSWQRTTN